MEKVEKIRTKVKQVWRQRLKYKKKVNSVIFTSWKVDNEKMGAYLSPTGQEGNYSYNRRSLRSVQIKGNL